MNYEVEKRGGLTKGEFTHLLRFFKSNGDFKHKKRRFQLVYLKRKDLKADLDYPVDYKIRITNGKGTIVLKYGDWHSGKPREKYEVGFLKEDLEDVLNINKILGQAWGACIYSVTHTFEYKGIEIALVHIYENFYYWEFEKLVNKKQEVAKAERKVNELIAELNLVERDSKDMKKHVEDLNKRKFWQFDFTKKDVGYYIGKYKKYIDGASR